MEGNHSVTQQAVCRKGRRRNLNPVQPDSKTFAPDLGDGETVGGAEGVLQGAAGTNPSFPTMALAWGAGGVPCFSHPGNRAPQLRFCSGLCSCLRMALTLWQQQLQDGITLKRRNRFSGCGWIHHGHGNPLSRERTTQAKYPCC